MAFCCTAPAYRTLFVILSTVFAKTRNIAVLVRAGCLILGLGRRMASKMLRPFHHTNNRFRLNNFLQEISLSAFLQFPCIWNCDREMVQQVCAMDPTLCSDFPFFDFSTSFSKATRLLHSYDCLRIFNKMGFGFFLSVKFPPEFLSVVASRYTLPEQALPQVR